MKKNNLYLFFSVFWDLYCAAPERRDTCDHSSEAKAFHDYVSTFPYVCLMFVCPSVSPEHSRPVSNYLFFYVSTSIYLTLKKPL